MKKIKVIYLALLCVAVSLFFTDNAFAAKEGDGLGYTVELVAPSTQIDPTKGYFYIKTIPGENQTLEARVKSTQKEAVKVKIYGADAYTGEAGTIEYSEDSSVHDPSLKNPITSMIKVDTPEITVENFEEKTVKIEVTPPKDSYEGVKVGALVFELAQDGEKKGGVSNTFSYRIGLITSESGDEFTNGQTLLLNSAKASLKRGKKMVLANLQNPEPKVLENLKIVATMTEKGNGKVVKTRTVENYSVAPNSNFDFELDWGVDDLPTGTYTLTLNISNDLQDWQLSKDFTITGEQAKKINEESAFKIITPNWIKVVTVILAIITVGTIATSLTRRKKWEKQWKKIRLAKRKKQANQKKKGKKNNKKVEE